MADDIVQSRVVRGWRNRLQDQIEQAQREVADYGADSVAAESAQRSAFDFRWGPQRDDDTFNARALDWFAPKRARTVDAGRREAQAKLRAARQELEERIKIADGRSVAAERAAKWYADLSPQKRTARALAASIRQKQRRIDEADHIRALARALRAARKADPDRHASDREKAAARAKRNRDKINAKRRARRALQTSEDLERRRQKDRVRRAAKRDQVNAAKRARRQARIALGLPRDGRGGGRGGSPKR